ncbi:rhodanese-like domain-containing protein [Nocardiopsis sp. NRRL B-16309]|uniref:rhodanese-like domain-containing protein n=1 Tax=Nocardiopsis sp. NRRL B-16309 TaxID=1519494 RepID=UPI0006ADBCEA|nr:rhodanese-like domain-containing protein [Nocardiopsis sp. NRRL B-16309]KOX08914.1 sulfurtransferase [Nocardiopsis sp. NRRL B-16309]
MTTHAFDSPAVRVPALSPAEAAVHFAARLALYTDVADVHASMALDEPGLVLVDTRDTRSWEQGRVPGAVHLPHPGITEEASGLVDPALTVVTYCWGPGCDGAARGALAFALLGYAVKEMVGGMEYWVREGLAVETDAGVARGPVDPLVGPVGVPGCAC